MNWETVNPEWWVPRGYCCVRVDERGSGKSPGQSRALFAAGGDRLLRRDRMGRPSALEQRPRRHHRHLVLRPHAVVGGQPQAAVAEMHRAVGRRRRSVPRHPLSRRHFRLRLHRRLVHHPHGASHARPRLRAQSGHVPGQRAVALHAQQPRQRRVQEPAGAMGQDRPADVGGRQLVRHGAASARRHRGLYARRVEAQEAAHPLRHALSIHSTARTAGATSCASSTTGSRTSTTA